MGDNIRVILRVRPMNVVEVARSSDFCVTFPGNNMVGIQGKNYSFDGVIKPNATQVEVFNMIAKPIISDVLNGFNGTIFAYGQTSSGKTFTMEGVVGNEELKGLIPRLIDGIFDFIDTKEGDIEFLIKVSYYEIYLEKVVDLFDTTKDNLPVVEDRNKVPYVKDGTERFVATPEEIMDCLKEGKQARHVTGTNMNAESSRSHSIFTINVKQDNKDTGENMNGKLFLVDLAGSEKVGKTGAEGQLLEEAKNINKSLSALGNVINALVEGITHIPYRDSKLTRILQQSLGGNSKTTMVICCSPSSYNEIETKSTLMFGMRAKSIKNKVVANVLVTAAEWQRRCDKEQDTNSKLRSIIENLNSELEKWRKGEKVPNNQWYTVDKYKQLLTGGAKSQTTTAPKSTLPAESISLSNKPSPMATGSDKAEDLYKLLDEKDIEINKLSQEVVKLKASLKDATCKADKLNNEADKASKQLFKAQNDYESTKREVKEVVTALEELALSFDQKASEYEAKLRDNDKLTEELGKITALKNQLEADGIGHKTQVEGQKTKFVDNIKEMINELGEAGMLLNEQLAPPSLNSKSNVDDIFTVIRLFISKVKSECKTAKKKITELDQVNATLLETSKESEKRINELKLSKEAHAVELKSEAQRIKELEVMLTQLEKQLKSSNTSEKEVKELRTELNHKNTDLAKLKSDHQQTLANLERTNQQYDLLKKETDNKTVKLELLEKHSTLKDQAKSELKGLEENVIRELQTLHNVRKHFISDLKGRIKKASAKGTVQQMIDTDEDSECENQKGSALQREKISFLENNLDNLTKVHKQLVRDNSDLRCELPKMEKRLKATMDRVKQLEAALKESKEASMRDRKRYQHEVDRIKEAVRRRDLSRPNVARPIKAGQRGATANT